MKKILITLMISILTTSCSEKSLTPLSSNATIVAFGDSLTFGYGAPTDKSYPKTLEEKINRTVINEGISGETTSDGLARIKEVLEQDKPSLIIIGLGGNDMLKKINENIIKNNLREMIEISKSSSVQVVLLATPKPSLIGVFTSLNDAEFYKEIAKEKNIPLINNVYSKWLSKSEYKSDPIHLNEKGYEKVAEHIAEFLKDNGAIEK
jgi:lysophospholipase L1-like esterase